MIWTKILTIKKKQFKNNIIQLRKNTVFNLENTGLLAKSLIEISNVI